MGLVHGGYHLHDGQGGEIAVGGTRGDRLGCFNNSSVVFAIHEVDADVFGGYFGAATGLANTNNDIGLMLFQGSNEFG